VVEVQTQFKADYRRIPFAQDLGFIHIGLNAGRWQSPTEMRYELLGNECSKRCLAITHHTYYLVCRETLAHIGCFDMPMSYSFESTYLNSTATTFGRHQI
jgi:hypothetical protein